jgi:2-polyprenyl-3-methyl-5-hydroxy-6-metoxy-1,4-benzoquinol methylase
MKCNYCNHKSLILLKNKVRDDNQLNIVKCLKCGFVQLDKFPSYNEDIEFYNRNEQAKWVSDTLDIKEQRLKLSNDTSRRVNYIIDNIGASKKIADIGTGYGFFCESLLLKNICIDGYEISSSRRAIAEEITKSKIYETNLLSGEEMPKKYDCITLFQVLEHISEPVKFIKKIFTSLNDDEKIIIEVPNYDDWLIKTSSDYCEFYYQKAHLFYYNTNSLERLFKDIGLTEYSFQYVQRYSITNAFNWIINKTPQIDSPSKGETNILSDIDIIYKKHLYDKGLSDTIIAIINK